MSKLKCRKLATIALSSCMAVCVGGAVVGFSQTNHASTAYAATAKYAVTENYSATVSQAKPATVTLSEKAGQYILTAVITDVDGEPISWDNWEFYDLVATVNGESVYLNYNLGTHTFTGVIMVGNQDTIELSTFTSSELSLSITLGDLYIGQGNDFTLSNVQIPANQEGLKINLDNLMGKYKISVDLGVDSLEEEKSITVMAGDNLVKLSKVNSLYLNTYTGELNFGDGATSLSIFTTSSVALTATISLSEVKEYAELPASVNLEMWTAVTYKYTATKTGYFSLNTSSADSNAEVAITFKNDAESFEGLNVAENNYPLYMEAGNVYYFELVLVNSSNGTNATINTTVANWVKPTVMTDIAYHVPATVAGKDKVTMDVVAKAGAYNLSLMNVPFNWYWDGIIVTANISGEEIDLTPANNYAETILLDGNTTISLTVKAAESTIPENTTLENTTLTLYIATPEVRNTIKINEATAITVPAADGEMPGNAIYYIENVNAGFYGITLSENNNVSVDANWLPAVFKGNTYGGFKITDNGSDIAIEFFNYSKEETKFTATVSQLSANYDMALGMDEIVINEGTTIYYLEGLIAGSYNLAIDDLPAGATVYFDGVEIMLVDGKAVLTVSEDQANRGLVTLMFMSKEEEFITVDITPANVMSLNEEKTINTEGDYTYAAYYMELEAGTYTIKFDMPEGMFAYVMVDGEWIAIEEQMGTFEVKKGGYVALKFDIYNYSTATSLTVEVTKA